MEKRVPVSRRIANIALSVVLVLGLLPAPAFAEETGGGNVPAPSVAEETIADEPISVGKASADSKTENDVAMLSDLNDQDETDFRLTVMTLVNVDASFTDVNYPWVVDGGALRSSNKDVDSSISRTEIAFTCTRDMRISFDWSVSSESSCDKLTITLDGDAVVSRQSGTESGSVEQELSSGTHTLALVYSKDSSQTLGRDCGEVSNLVAAALCDKHTATVTVPAVPATCIQPGSAEASICSVCGKTLSIVEPVPALGHSYMGGVCGRCGAKMPYAVLYEGGHLAFQDTDQALPRLGRIANSWSFNPGELFDSKAPWHANKDSISSISFECEVAPISTAHWFEGMSNLASINLTNLDTSAATSMNSMFYGCASLKSVDLSSFDVSKVEDMSYMFYGCTSLATIYASLGFSTSAETSSHYMFYDCPSIVGGNGTHFALYYTDKSWAKVDGYDGPGYFTLKDGLAPGWMLCGTCKWMIDDDGLLTVRPLVDGSSGVLAGWSNYYGAPWYNQRASVKSATIEPSVSASSCAYMFYDCALLSSVNLLGLDASSVTDMSSMFYGCSSLAELVLPAGLNLLDHGGCDLRDTPWRDSSGTSYVSTYEMLSVNAARKSGIEVYSATSAIPGWRQSGTCKWMIDDDGLLTVRPLSGLVCGELENWGNNSGPWYSQHESIKSAVFMAGVSAKTCHRMFEGCSSLASLDLSGLDTSNVKDMRSMFSGCSSLASLDLSGLDTSKATSMYRMLYGCSLLASLDLSGLSTSSMMSVTDMDSMLSGCLSLAELTLPAHLDLSRCGLRDTTWGDSSGNGYVSTYEMLSANNARKSGTELYSAISVTPGWRQSGTCEWTVDDNGLLTVRPLSGLKHGELENWKSGKSAPWCSERTSIKSAVFMTGISAKTCQHMFESCSSLESVDLSGLDTSKVKDMYCMFNGCKLLSSLDLSGFVVSSATNVEYMLGNCKSLDRLTLPAGVDFSNTFLRSAGWKSASGDMYGSTQEMFAANAARKTESETYESIKPTPGWESCGACEWTVDPNGLLVVRPLPGLACGELAYWGNYYDDVPWYSQRDFIKFAVIEHGVAARTCSYMFRACPSLSSVDLSGLDTSKATNMGLMFSGCSSLSSIDLSGLNTSSVTYMDYMFAGCSSLKSIYVSKGFATASIKDSSSMFFDCDSLVGGMGTAYDSSFTDATRARIDGGANAPGYFTGKHARLDGDINGNGVLNMVDAQIAYDIATTDLYKDRADYADMRLRADVTWDGEVYAEDAFAIQRAALRGWRN